MHRVPVGPAPATSLQRHAPEVIAGGDEEGAVVRAAEGAVAGFVGGGGDEVDEATAGREDVTAGFELVGLPLGDTIGSCGDVDPACGILFHPIGSASVFPIEDDLGCPWLDIALFIQPVAQQFPRSALRVVVVIRNVERPIIRCDEDAIGPLRSLTMDAGHLPHGIDAIDAFKAQLHALARTVTGIGKIDPPLGIHAEIIRRVEALPLKTIRQNGDATILLGAGHATQARLTSHEASFLIKEQTVGGIVPEHRRAAFRVHAIDVLTIREVERAVLPSRTFTGTDEPVILWNGTGCNGRARGRAGGERCENKCERGRAERNGFHKWE
jgi:hypothetical protein